MKYALFSLLFFLVAVPKGEGQTWSWANGTRGSNNYGRFSSVDPHGDIYVTGETFTGMNFISDTVNNIGYTRVYLSKFDSSGNLKWIKTNTGRNTTGRIGSLGIASDLFGNTFILGCYDSVITYGGNTLTNASLGLHTAPSHLSYLFLAKFDSSGNNKWVKSIGNFPIAFWNTGNGIEVDCDGNIYLACNFFKDATIGSFSFLNNDTSGNSSDMLIAKLDSSANVVWAKHFGGDSIDYVTNIALLPNNDINITGAFYHHELSIGSYTMTDMSGLVGMSKTFIAKLDNSGGPLWAKKVGESTYAAYITDIVANETSEFYTSGYYSKDLVLGTLAMPYAYGSNSYIAKYDVLGNILWAKAMKGSYVYSEGVTLDGCENVWVLGHFGSGVVTSNDTIDGHVIMPPLKNKEPLFIAGWSSSGGYINTTVLASGGRSSYKISTVTDQDNKLYIVGNNTLDTLLVAEDTLYGTNSYTNMFLAKYDMGITCSPYTNLNCISLGLPDIDIVSAGISIFPNPANTQCTILANHDWDGKCTIFDIAGHAIRSFSLSREKTIVPTANLSSGTYFFRIEIIGVGVINKKVVIMN